MGSLQISAAVRFPTRIYRLVVEPHPNDRIAEPARPVQRTRTLRLPSSTQSQGPARVVCILQRKGVEVQNHMQVAGCQHREVTPAGHKLQLQKTGDGNCMKTSEAESLQQPSNEQLALAACSKARSNSTKNEIASEIAPFQSRSTACPGVAGAALDAVLQPLLRTLVCAALVLLTSASSVAFVSPAAAGAAPLTVLSGPSLGVGRRSAQSAIPLSTLAFVEYASVFDVPNPRADHGGWVVDDASVMSDSQKGHIEHVAQKVKDATGAEIAVVTVNQLSGKTTPKAFATELFNTWGVGDREKNNGVLVLLVKEQRRLEIEIGRGLNRPLNKASWLKGMQKETMVPLLKKNDFGGGLVAGVDALADKLRAVEAKPVANEKVANEKASKDGVHRRLLIAQVCVVLCLVFVLWGVESQSLSQPQSGAGPDYQELRARRIRRLLRRIARAQRSKRLKGGAPDSIETSQW